MSGPVYKTMKVFDCQDMPENMQSAFFSLSEKGNDVYISWEIEDAWEGSPQDIRDKVKLINDWLLDNGADKNESVLINHWW